MTSLEVNDLIELLDADEKAFRALLETCRTLVATLEQIAALPPGYSPDAPRIARETLARTPKL